MISLFAHGAALLWRRRKSWPRKVSALEVVDLRSLKPSGYGNHRRVGPERLGRVVGVTEAYKTGSSFISELFTRINESAFDWLDAPMVRVAAADVPVPMAESLEDAAIPNVDAIIAVRVAQASCAEHA